MKPPWTPVEIAFAAAVALLALSPLIGLLVLVLVW